MPDFSVATTFFGKDKVSQVFKTMGFNGERFGKDATLAFRKASRSASRFGDVTKGILTAGIINKAIGGLSRGVRSITQQFIEFDDAIVGATARFKDIGPDAANFNEQLKILKDRARDAGATTEFTAAQAASALNFLAKAGFNSVEAMGSLNSMINLATASGEEFATVADFSSDLLGAFGLAVDDSAQKIKNLERLNNVLVKSANTANVTIETMFETMKDAAPIGTKLGISLEEVAAATAFLGGVGIKGSKAATALKNSFLNLAALPKKTADALAEINVTVDDGTGNMKKFSTVISEIGTSLKGVGTLKTARVLDAIFGKRAIAGAANLMDGVAALNAFEKSLLDADGVAQRTADRLRQSLGNRLKALGSAATEFGFKFLDAFQVDGKQGIDALTNAIRAFDPTPIIDGLKTAFKFTKLLLNVIEPFIPLLPVLIGMWLSYGAAVKGVAAFQAIKGLIIFVGLLKQTTTVMGILNAVMLANPVGAIVVGVGLLIGALILLVKHWDKVKAAIGGAFSKITSVGSRGGLFGSGREVGSDSVRESGNNESSASPKIIPPNREEIAGRKMQFEGQLNIAGAPSGSTFEDKSTAPSPFNVNMLGAN
jgi:TP901 family phage tail tape measure protein